MKQVSVPSNKNPQSDWQILGELELSISSEFKGAINVWVQETLTPLTLQMDLLKKILKSVQDSATRVMSVESGLKSENIHWIILVPLEYISKGRTWGFFRIEKIENAMTDDRPPDHAIEFYLYLEG